MLKRIVQIGLLALGGIGFALLIPPLSSLLQTTQPTAQIAHDHRAMGHFQPKVQSDFDLSLIAPSIAVAQSAGETLTLAPEAAYNPTTLEGTDDYHCFLLDPKLTEDRMVTGANIKPDAGTIVHHVILFKITGDSVVEARQKNQETGGKGWTCFGGPEVGDSRNVGGSWLGAWVPGAGEGRFPAGLGNPLPKGSLVVMQVHYNLIAGSKPDRSQVVLSFAPKGLESGLRPLSTQLLTAPVEIPCPDGNQSPVCNRTQTLRDNVKKFGQSGAQLPQGLLAVCNKSLSEYQKPVGDASAVSTSCERRLRGGGMLYSVAGHMHLLGKEIKLELISSGQSKTLLHIPAWDFHWQGNYWFKNPVQVKAGDVVRITCIYNNSTASQPVIAGKQLEPRYITWGEGTTDEMCLGVVGFSGQ